MPKAEADAGYMTAMLLVVMWLAVLAQGQDDFSAARVEAHEVTSVTMEVDVEVTLRNSDGPVVAHLLLPGEQEVVSPLARRGDTRWGAVVELRRADWRVMFEDVATGARSQPASLTELGLDPAVLGMAEDPEPVAEDESSVALAAALATFAGLVTLVAVAALYRRRTPRARS